MDFLEALEFTRVKEQFKSRAASSLGKKHLDEALMRREQLWITRELQRVQEAFTCCVKKGVFGFSGLSDTSEMLQASRKDQILEPMDFIKIMKVERCVVDLKTYMNDMKTPKLDEIMSSLLVHDSLLQTLLQAISDEGEIKDGASPALKEIRQELHHTQAQITKETNGLIQKYSSYLMEHILVRRNDRACLLVKASDKHKIKGFIHGESASGQAVYIEPETLLRLNNNLTQLYSKEEDEILRILHMLTQVVASVADELDANKDSLGLLDAIFAKGKWMKDFDGCVGSVTNDQHLYIAQARHPLIDQKHVVENTYELKPEQRLLLISGSNTGGKTVTLKTIGLFVALTLSGFPIAAKKASIPLYKAIYSDIGDAQSIQESLSTFSAHISTLSTIIEEADASSLVLLDELGSGTDPKEGEALAISILDYFRTNDISVVATTHFSELKKYAKEHDDVLLASVAFDEEKMIPTYHYQEGISGQSNAFSIARRYNLREDILTHAKDIRDQMKSEADHMLERLEVETQRQLDLQDALQKEQEQVLVKQKIMEEDYQKEVALLREKEQALKVTFEEELKKVQQQATQLLDDLKNKQIKPHEFKNVQTKIEELYEPEVVEDVTFHVGDYVRIEPYNYYGEILSIKKENAQVFANQMKMTIALKDLRPAKKLTQKKKSTHITKTVSSARVPLELNVIGQTREEALQQVSKYLDQAVIAKKISVRIVHGVGTLVLKKAIDALLQKTSYVKSFETAPLAQGGLGATIVYLGKKES